MDQHNIQFVGAPCGRHAQNTFYKAFKYLDDGKNKILTLGEFFFMKISKNSPVCIGELQMIYSIKNQEDEHVMTSVRAYFLPEHTPEGRQENHGEDELFAFSEKLILKADDLVTLLEDKVRWTFGRSLFHEDELEGEITNSEELDQRLSIRDLGVNLADVDKEKEAIGHKRSESSTHLTILSYPQYCRYRAVMRRLENVTDKWLKNSMICALGGIISQSKDNRIMFCRDTFYDADLDELEINCEHLAPNLKGRKRKKKLSITGENGDSDSNDVSSEHSAPSATKDKGLKSGKRESALRNGFRIDKMKVSKDEQEFLFSLHKFMKRRNTPIGRIPSLGFKQIDLFMFWSEGMKIGGYEAITQKRMWKHLYDILGGNPGSTSAATCTRRHYERLLLPYERHTKGDHLNKPLPLKQKKSRILGRPPGRPLGRPPKDKERKITLERKENREPEQKVSKENDVSEEKTEVIKKKKVNMRERFRMKLQEKAMKWEEMRVQKARDKEKQLRRVNANPRTVKNILNSAIANKTPSEHSVDVKTEKTENTNESADKTDIVKDPRNDCVVSPSKHVANQSKLFRPPDVQSSAKSEDKILTPPNPLISPHGLHPSAHSMFFPHPYLQLGAMHPMGLPIIHQIPMAMQQYLPSPVPAAKQTHRPNILKNSPNPPKSSVLSNEHDKQAANSLFQHPAHSHNNQKEFPGKSPPAHTNHKRSHESMYSPNYNIPSHKSSLSNKSVLFDFEAPKRIRKDNDRSVNQSSKSSGAVNDEQPQDLSMKTLCKKSDSRLSSSNNVLDLGQTPSTSKCADDTMKSKKSEMTLNLPKHSMANILKTPSFSKRSSPDVFSANKSPVFSPSSQSPMVSTSMSTSSSHPPVLSPVHPAFPQFIRSPMPQPNIFPSQLQQLYEAQIRATQFAALEEMMQRDRNMYPRMPFPMFMPQVPLHMNSTKDKNSYAHAK